MAFGPGKYDELASHCRQVAAAKGGVIVIVFQGNQGSGMSAQLDPLLTLAIPDILRDVAKTIEAAGVTEEH
jgi:hypothetical protein